MTKTIRNSSLQCLGSYLRGVDFISSEASHPSVQLLQIMHRIFCGKVCRLLTCRSVTGNKIIVAISREEKDHIRKNNGTGVMTAP